MAYQSNSAAAQTASYEKATAFINLWITKPDGSRAKLGAIPLKDSVAFQNGVIARLEAGGDEALESLKGVLQIDFKMVNTQPVAASDVGF